MDRQILDSKKYSSLRATCLHTTGRDDLALVHLLQLGPDNEKHLVETVDSIDPRYPRSEKSVIIISTQFGCPVRCQFCDAGGTYYGNLSVDQLLAQIQYVADYRPDVYTTKKLKVHFARMGEPSLNDNVLDALDRLPTMIPNPNLLPALATVAPATRVDFFKALLALKEKHYDGRFQLQLSINTSDTALRSKIMPVALMPFEQLADLSAPFHGKKDRKVALNFALGKDNPVDASTLIKYFAPKHFMIKLTPINPTDAAVDGGFESLISADNPLGAHQVVSDLEAHGYDVVVSIGDADEIQIGSNCGQFVNTVRNQATIS